MRFPQTSKKKKIKRPRSHHHFWAPTTVQLPCRDSHCSSRHCKHTHSHSHSQTNRNTQKQKRKIKKEREREKHKEWEVAFKEIAKVFATKIRRRFDETSQILYKAKKKQIQQNKNLKKKLLIYFFIFSLRFFTFPLSFLIFHFFSFLLFSSIRIRGTHTFFSFLVLFSVWLLRKTKEKLKIRKTNQDGFSCVLTFCYFLIKVKLYISLLLFVWVSGEASVWLLRKYRNRKGKE